MLRLNLNDEARTRIRKISGLVVGAFTVFTLISVVSYLFTWEADSSLRTAEGFLPKGVDVGNWGGGLGFRWSSFLVGRCFGLGSFALIFLLWAVFVRLFFKNRPVRLLRAVVLTLSGACLSSVILSYISSMCCDDLFFGERAKQRRLGWGQEQKNDIQTDRRKITDGMRQKECRIP